MSRFSDQTVLVTGGGSGIGRACALAFAREGARVVVVDLDLAAADQTVRLIDDGDRDAARPPASRIVLDVRDEAAVRTQLQELLSRSAVDVLVNSAGIGATRPFLETDLALLDRMYAVNFRGAFLCSQVIAQSMVDAGIAGRIVHIGSASGARGNAGRAAYGATKAALANLTQVMAVELAAHGLRVNAVAPGPIETPLVGAAHTPSVRDGWLKALPIARYGDVDDVANAVLFVASAHAAYVTGHVLYVDGGFQGAGVMHH